MRALIIVVGLSSMVLAEESAIFTEDSKWETVGEGYNIVEGIAATKDGNLYLTDVPDSELIRLGPDGKTSWLDKQSLKANGLAIGSDGTLYGASMAEPAILAWNLNSGTRSTITLPSPANDLAITVKGQLYCTWGAANAVYQLDLANPKPEKVADLPNPNGITLSHDGKELWVGEFYGDTVRAFPLLPDGRLGPARAAFKALVPPDGKGLLDGMTPLKDGRLLAATALGLQILSAKAAPVLIANPTAHRANYVRIISDPAGHRWIYVSHVKSVLRRRTLL
jgi:gluconolactonase